MPKLCNGALLYISDWVKSLCSRDSGWMFVDCFCNSINVRSDSRPVWIWWLGGIILIYLASVFVNNPVSDPRTQLCQCLNLNVWFNWIYSYSKIIEYSPITKWNMYSRKKEYQRMLIETCLNLQDVPVQKRKERRSRNPDNIDLWYSWPRPSLGLDNALLQILIWGMTGNYEAEDHTVCTCCTK